MRAKGKRLLALLVAVSLLLAGCATQVPGQEQDATVFLPEFIDFDVAELGIESINTGCCDGTDVYVLAEAGFETEETDPVTGETYTSYEYRTTIFRFPLDGSGPQELENFAPLGQGEEKPVDRESYSHIESISVGADGTLWVSESLDEYIYDVPEDFDPESDYIWNYEMLEYKSTRVRRQLDRTGAEIARVDTGGMEEALGFGEDGGYIGSSVTDNDGNTYVFAEIYTDSGYETKVAVLDKDLKVLFEVKEQDLWGQLVLLGDGSAALSYYKHDRFTGEGGQILRVIDLEEKDWGKEYPMPVNAGNVYPGSGDYLFYYDNGDSLYGYSAEEEAGKKILTWSTADINRSDISFFTFLADGRIAAMTRHWGQNGMEAEIAILSEQPISVLEDRTVLVFATQYLGYDMRQRIIEFNKSQTDYRIQIRDYSEFNTADDYNAGLTKLNTEIIAGQVPDILDTTGLPVRQYGAKGLLEDLWPFIDGDGELGGREGLMVRPLEAASQEGKLYSLFNSFTIRTAAGAPDVVGEELSWSLADLEAALAKMPEGCDIFSDSDTKEYMLRNVLAMQMDNFVDWTTGECWFDSEGFTALLEFCDSFPLEYDWNSYDSDEYESDLKRIANGKQLLSMETLYDMQYIQVQEYIFGGDVTYVGYPREDGGVGSSFQVEGGLAMSTTCKDKEAAWAFIRDMLLPQSQPEDEYFYFDGWGFPVNKQDFDHMAKQYMTPQYMLDENGEPMLDENGEPMEYSQGGIGWGDGEMVELYATTQEQYDKVMALYGAIDSVYSFDESIYSIVRDVALRYFNGDITTEAAADQIQSRVKIYVNENL